MSRRPRLLTVGQGSSGRTSGQAHRWADVALVERRRRTAAAFVSEGQLRADLEERIAFPYLDRANATDRARRRGGAR